MMVADGQKTKNRLDSCVETVVKSVQPFHRWFICWDPKPPRLSWLPSILVLMTGLGHGTHGKVW